MDQALLVEQQIDDGQELIDLLISAGFDVSAAAWVKPSEEDRWLLYLVSKDVDERGLSAAYRAVHPVLGKLQAPWVSLGDLKLVGLTNPVATDIVEINRKYPGRSPIRTRRPQLGGTSINEAHVYPMPGQMPPWFEKMNRTYPSAEVLAVPVPFNDLDVPALGSFMGHVNGTEFLGKPPGTVMFVGPEGKGSRPMGKLIFVYRPEGWNTLFNPQTQRWEEVRFAGSGQPLYQSADFSTLVAEKAERGK
jgi:hypothetical protein